MRLADFLAAFDALPEGRFTGAAGDRRYVVAKTGQAGHRSRKLVAEELGGSDFISLNLYRLADGSAILRPCEMAEEKVVDFVLALRPDQ